MPHRSHIVIFNNMITPYSSRVYDLFNTRHAPLVVVSCSTQESNRRWASEICPSYEHVVLPGVELRVGASRYAHFNRGIVAAFERLNPRVLVVTGFYPSMLVAVAWATWRKVPLVLLTDGWKHTMPRSLLHRVVRPWVIRRAERIVVSSEKGRDYFIEEGKPSAAVVKVPLVPAWDPPPTNPPFGHRQFDIVWCGHFDADVKNVPFFIEVCGALRRKLPSLRVRLVGSGPLKDAVLEAFKHDEIDFVWDEYIPWDQMSGVFCNAKLLMVPSKTEAWGLVCSEAASCGTPAMVSPFVGAAGDLVQNGRSGFVMELVAKEWSERAGAILESPTTWNALSRGAREIATKRTLASSVDTLADTLLPLASDG